MINVKVLVPIFIAQITLVACSGFPSNQADTLAASLLLGDVNRTSTASSSSGSSSTGTAGPFVFNSGWNCAASTDCQDVYDFTITNPIASDTLTVAATAITGSSAIRLAVFAPGSGLNGVNQINGGTTDHRCVPFNTNDTVNVTGQTLTGTYRVALGRDWNNSGGNSGTYTLTVSFNAAKLTSLGQTVDDTATLLTAATTCP
ncbi:MAG: hypothetical protein JNM27_17555 [Leptospirales bacterium]|nr:hypothetical protein [Leptospirales bacterium]